MCSTPSKNNLDDLKTGEKSDLKSLERLWRMVQILRNLGTEDIKGSIRQCRKYFERVLQNKDLE